MMGINWLVLAVTVVTAGVAGAAAWLSRRSMVAYRGRTSADGAEADLEVARGSGYSMARIGLITNVIFVAIILFESIPIFFYVRNCGTWIE